MPSSIYETLDEVARVAAQSAVETLTKAIEQHGSAVWVLAGGTSPMLAYQQIRDKYVNALDWAKITILIGDERVVPLSDPDSNSGTIFPLFDDDPRLAVIKKIVPQPELGEIDMALSYEVAIKDQAPRFDLVWIGVGEDGHTLSLFPGNAAFVTKTDRLVVPVYDAPKLPPTRISLSLKALERTERLVIFAVGEAKRTALKRAKIDQELPITKVATVVEKSGGVVEWLYDRAAAGENTR